MIFSTKARQLRAGSALPALALAALVSAACPTSAWAQDPGKPVPTPPAAGEVTSGPNSPAQVDKAGTDNAEATDNAQEIVVTGTLFRRTNTETPSPVTVLSADNLAKRGITTVSDAVSLLSANGAGTLPNGFSAGGGAFANGAAAVSLRGLTTDSTLVLFDGLRAAYYPLSDDGTRNFVDLNTIPDSIVDRVEVLKDGASSTYGADAVAGVVNIIVKKEIKGLQVTAEGGVSQRGDGGSQRLAATYGYGDLGTNGYNVYLNAEYQRDEPIYLSQRGYPFNTGDFSRYSTTADGGTIYGVNTNPNGLKGDGTFGGIVGATIVPIVRPATSAGDILSGVAVPGSSYQLLNPAAGCGRLTRHDVGGTIGTVCEQDLIKDYQEAQSLTTRFGSTAHFTAQLNDKTQAYAMFTYYQDKVTHIGNPISIRRQTNTGDFNSNTIVLPAVLTSGANAGQLNPNDPFAAAGFDALIRYRFADLPTEVTSLSRSYRGSAGINGEIGNGFNYTVDVTGMKTTLKTTQTGYIYAQGLVDVISDGSYNFVDPSQNTQATLDRLSPVNRSRASSKLFQGQITITKDLFDLPSGQPLQLAVGGSGRYESLNDPSANPDNPTNPSQQYFTINGFGAIGHRYVESGFFEINAPVLKVLEINGSGRYDHYSSGFSNFSPKIGAKFTPVSQISFRGTFSKGFRVPSFAESNALPTIGFSNADLPESFLNQHLDANGKPDDYTQYMVGLNASGTPGLKPEKSTSFTGGFVAQPVRWLSFTVDYYHIKKTRVIVNADPTAAFAAYYAGQPIPAGFTITQDTLVDDLHPDAQRRAFAVNYGFVNADSQVSSGIDLEATVQLLLADDIKLTSTLSGTYVIANTLTTADGEKQVYAGTLGPCNITSCSGTPRYRANWQNTIDIKQFSLTATAYYTSGYKTTAEDVGGAGTRNDCSTIEGTHALYDDGTTPVQCHVHRFIDVDMTGSIKVNENFTFYVNVLNIFDAKPPVDLVTYGQNGYNPAWSQSGLVGRFFRAGAKVTF